MVESILKPLSRLFFHFERKKALKGCKQKIVEFYYRIAGNRKQAFEFEFSAFLHNETGAKTRRAISCFFFVCDLGLKENIYTFFSLLLFMIE